MSNPHWSLRLTVHGREAPELAALGLMNQLSESFIDPKRVVVSRVPGAQAVVVLPGTILYADHGVKTDCSGRNLLRWEQPAGVDGLTTLSPDHHWMKWAKVRPKLAQILADGRTVLAEGGIRAGADVQFSWTYSGTVHVVAPSCPKVAERDWYFRQLQSGPQSYFEICICLVAVGQNECEMSFTFWTDVMSHIGNREQGQWDWLPRESQVAVDANATTFVDGLRKAVLSAGIQRLSWEFQAEFAVELAGAVPERMRCAFGPERQRN
jgi:hypothetical protein